MAFGKLLIGWSRGDITPPRKTLVQGQFHTRISDEVVSPLTATGLALEVPQDGGGGDQAVFLSCDLRDRIGVGDKGIIARRIMAAVEEGLATASPGKREIELTHTVKTLRLPRLMVTDAQYEHERRIYHMSADELAEQPFGFKRVWPFGLVCDLLKRYEQQGETPVHETECHIIRLGDAVFATNPFELFVDYAMRMRCRSRALQTFLVQLADGSGNGYYLPTQKALNGGHYSALIKSNWVGPQGGQMLVDETVQAIADLFADNNYPRTR